MRRQGTWCGGGVDENTGQLRREEKLEDDSSEEPRSVPSMALSVTKLFC